MNMNMNMKMKLKVHVIALAVLGAMLALTGTSQAAKSGDPIKIAVNDWTGQHISAHITGQLLEKAGYNIEYVTAGTVPQLTGIAQGNLHLQPEFWDNNVGAIYEKALETGDIVKVGALGLSTYEGWMYPAYMKAKCPGLPAASALVKCAQAFGSAETYPKGRLITYPADWGTKSKDLVAAENLPFQAIAGGSDGAMIAELKSAYAAKEPVLMMFWEPHWIFAEYDMEWVDMAEWGFAQAGVSKLVWSGFKDKWPGAYKLVQQLVIDNKTQNNLMLEIDNKKRDLDEVVSEYLAATESTWKPWVKAAQ